MGVIETILLATGLSMDAFAAAVCKGLSNSVVRKRDMATVGLWFGGFQALMPGLGYFLGRRFERRIIAVDHWVAFVFLAVIGVNMIRESRGREEETLDASFGAKAMFPLAVATSIDALAVGVTFAFLSAPIVPAVSLIGCVTFVGSAVGVKIGNLFGAKYKSGAELGGGVVLILMGLKILIEHLAEG